MVNLVPANKKGTRMYSPNALAQCMQFFVYGAYILKNRRIAEKSAILLSDTKRKETWPQNGAERNWLPDWQRKETVYIFSVNNCWTKVK